jgi:hypothetical protein
MAELNRSTQYWCVGCMKQKDKSGFIQSLSPYHNKYLPLCRACVNARYEEYHKKLKSEGAALWCLCAEMGYPVIQEYYNIAMSRRKDTTVARQNLFMLYHNTIKEIGFMIEGFWQSDMELSDFIDIGTDREEKEENSLDLIEMERLWGKFEVEDYELLNGFFNMYTQELPNMDTALELRYRDLCKAELRKRKADENGDIGEITKAEESLRKNMALLKLDKFQDNKQSEVEKHIERMCWMVENTKPCECEDLEKYKDFSGFGIKWAEIMRCMRNLIANTRDYPDIAKGEE